MSRSRKKAIYKDGNGPWKTSCRRAIKRTQKNFLRSNLQDLMTGDKVIPDGKTIVNDYTYSDYTYDMEHHDKRKYINDEDFAKLKEKLSRK